MKTKRLMTEDEKRWRRHQRSAAKKNAQDLAEAPLFAPLLPVRTAESEYWHWRFNVSSNAGERMSEYRGHQFLSWFRLNEIRRYMRQLLGDETYERLNAYSERTYPCLETYGYCFWQGVLTGERIVTALQRREDRKPVETATIETEVYQHQHMTREQFWAMFPFKSDEPAEQHDGGLSDAIDSLDFGAGQFF